MRLVDDFGERETLYVFAELRIMDNDLIPQVVTDALDFQPTESWLKDSLDQYGLKHATGCWLLYSKEYVASDDLNVHLDWLLSLLETKQKECLNLQERFSDLRIMLSGRCNTLEFNIMPSVNPEIISRLANLQLGLDLFVSFK